MRPLRHALLGLLLAACNTSEPAVDLQLAQTLEIRNARSPEPGLLCAGQLTEPQIEALLDSGYRSFVTLRAPEEKGAEADAALLGQEGAHFTRLTIRGAEDINEQNARRLDTLLADLERPLVLYCGSSNRVGALYGARAFYVQGASPAEALEAGRRAGVTRLEGRLRELTGG